MCCAGNAKDIQHGRVQKQNNKQDGTHSPVLKRRCPADCDQVALYADFMLRHWSLCGKRRTTLSVEFSVCIIFSRYDSKLCNFAYVGFQCTEVFLQWRQLPGHPPSPPPPTSNLPSRQKYVYGGRGGAGEREKSVSVCVCVCARVCVIAFNPQSRTTPHPPP